MAYSQVIIVNYYGENINRTQKPAQQLYQGGRKIFSGMLIF